jgi:hypothetical protein
MWERTMAGQRETEEDFFVTRRKKPLLACKAVGGTEVHDALTCAPLGGDQNKQRRTSERSARCCRSTGASLGPACRP